MRETRRSRVATAALAAVCVAAGSLRAGTFRSRPFLRGDADGSGTLELTDAVRLLRHLFLGDPPELGCGDAADADDSGRVELTDAVYLLGFLYRGGPAPPPPRGQPGYDPTAGDAYPCGDEVVAGGGRASRVRVPPGYDPSVPAPLLLGLHGYSGTGADFEAGFGLAAAAAALGVLYVTPDGTVDAGGLRFWNATDACCDFFGSAVDDSAYLRGLVEEISTTLNVDPRRVYVVGHSNGGFMAYRMACDHAERVAAVISVAGATYLDGERCAPSEPVHVLQIHGTRDPLIHFEGGSVGELIQDPEWPAYPGARETVEIWAAHGGCALEPEEGPRRDVDGGLAGAEARVERYVAGCRPGGSAELWVVEGGGHSFVPAPGFTQGVVEWLLEHPKP